MTHSQPLMAAELLVVGQGLALHQVRTEVRLRSVRIYSVLEA